MNKLIIAIISCILVLSSTAQNSNNKNYHSKKYCATTQNGQTVIMHEGKAITKDVTLSNGIKIATDGMITKNNGTQVSLKSGQCIDMNGNIMDKSMKNKNWKNKDWKDRSDTSYRNRMNRDNNYQRNRNNRGRNDTSMNGNMGDTLNNRRDRNDQ